MGTRTRSSKQRARDCLARNGEELKQVATVKGSPCLGNRGRPSMPY